MRDFRQLSVWQKAHGLALMVHGVTGKFPQQERFGVGAQMRRVAISIPMRIAEGAGRSERIEFIALLHNALGLASELEYLLLLAKDLELITADSYDALQNGVVEVRKMLSGLSKTVASQAILRAES